MFLLKVDPGGSVAREDLETYSIARREKVAERLQIALETNDVAKKWLESLGEQELYEEKDGERKYTGDASAEEETKAALGRAKTAGDAKEIVAAIEDLILCFCGFSVMRPLRARCIVNAVHFQFKVNVEQLLSTNYPLPSADGTPSDACKALFDDAQIGLAELLLRCVVETPDGGLLANPFSPGMPMGKLLKLPLFAQFIMVLTNAVEAVWYQEAVPTCPMGINLYASLLVPGAPVQQLTEGVRVVEVMEMTKGAKRGAEVDEWVAQIRASGAIVMLDDFDGKHPGLGSKPDGIKVSVFVNAFHSLQTFKNEPPFLPIGDIEKVEKEKTNPFDVQDYYGNIVPTHQPGVKLLVMEGSENCLKSEVSPGPPLNFSEPKATTASAHVYQAAARAMQKTQPEGQVFEMYHQGGRALYADEDFDPQASEVIQKSTKPMAAARTGDAGTMAWMGVEAVRRAGLQQRLPVCGVVKKT